MFLLNVLGYGTASLRKARKFVEGVDYAVVDVVNKMSVARTTPCAETCKLLLQFWDKVKRKKEKSVYLFFGHNFDCG